MNDDDWVTAALTDDSLVADVLLRLRHEKPPPAPMSESQAALQLEWTVRQQRSKSVPRKNEGELTRASPSTPLLWSDGTGTSHTSSGESGGRSGGGGVEESGIEADAPRPIENVRSKVAVTNELANTKRPRRRKTLVQLSEQESLLLNERRDMTNILTTFYRNIEMLRGKNEKLKRLMKLDLQSQATGKLFTTSIASEETISDQLQETGAGNDQACSNAGTSAACNNPDSSLPIESSMVVEKVSCKEPSFMLPDLNLPCEDGFIS